MARPNTQSPNDWNRPDHYLYGSHGYVTSPMQDTNGIVGAAGYDAGAVHPVFDQIGVPRSTLARVPNTHAFIK
jgi:hypothetical protein